MKEKEPESYIEKPRVHRDRTKKRRPKADEVADNENTKPKMEPYKRKKDWMQLPNDEPDESNGIIECPIHEKYYEDDGFSCPYCTEI